MAEQMRCVRAGGGVAEQARGWYSRWGRGIVGRGVEEQAGAWQNMWGRGRVGEGVAEQVGAWQRRNQGRAKDASARVIGAPATSRVMACNGNIQTDIICGLERALPG